MSIGTRWSATELADDPAAAAAAQEAEALLLRRQVERVTGWLANEGTAPEWDEAAYATQNWLRLSPAELREVSEAVIGVFQQWADREIPDDGVEREPVLVFSRGFPCQP